MDGDRSSVHYTIRIFSALFMATTVLLFLGAWAVHSGTGFKRVLSYSIVILALFYVALVALTWKSMSMDRTPEIPGPPDPH